MFLIALSLLIYKYYQQKKRKKDRQNLPLNEVKIDSSETDIGRNDQIQEIDIEDSSALCKNDLRKNSTGNTKKLENENKSTDPKIEILGMLNTDQTKKTGNNLRKSTERRSNRKRKLSIKKENRPVLLNNQAIKRHIFPNCCSDAEAVRFSQRRNELSDTLINTVLKIEPFEFHLQQNGRYLCSNRKVQFWQCQRYTFRGNFKVTTLRIK